MTLFFDTRPTQFEELFSQTFSGEKRLSPVFARKTNSFTFACRMHDCCSSTLTFSLFCYWTSFHFDFFPFLFFSYFFNLLTICVVSLLLCSKFFCVNSSAKFHNMHGYLNANTTLYSLKCIFDIKFWYFILVRYANSFKMNEKSCDYI